jgi:transcriptional regulator with XRE-family HTH domain
LRLDEKLKQGQAAKKMGLTQGQLSNYEGDRVVVIPSRSFRALSEGYGVSIHWLMTGLGEKYLQEKQSLVQSRISGQIDFPELNQEMAEQAFRAFNYIESKEKLAPTWDEPPDNLAYGWEVDPWSVIRLKGLNERIIEARGDIDIKDMAERVSLELSSYRAMEAGKIFPNREKLKRIVAASGCDARWLACGAVEENTISEFASELKGDLSDIAGRIRAVRNQLKLNQTKFAEHVNLTVNQIREIETSRSKPSVDVLKNIVQSTEATLDYLVFGSIEVVKSGKEQISVSLKRFLQSDEVMLVMSPSEDEVEYLIGVSQHGKYIFPDTWRQILIDYRKANIKKK